MSKLVLNLKERFPLLLKHFPQVWYPYLPLTGALTHVKEIEESIGKLIEGNIIPKYENIWAPFTDISPDDVVLILIAEMPYTKLVNKNHTPIADGLCFSTSNSSAEMELRVLLEATWLAKAKVSHEKQSIGSNKMLMLRNKQQNWSLKNWRAQGTLLVNMAPVLDMTGTPICPSAWAKFINKLLMNLLLKQAKNDIAIVTFGENVKNKCKLYQGAIKKNTSHEFFHFKHCLIHQRDVIDQLNTLFQKIFALVEKKRGKILILT